MKLNENNILSNDDLGNVTGGASQDYLYGYGEKGIVTRLEHNDAYRIELDSGETVYARLSQMLIIKRLRVFPGDRVTVQTNSKSSYGIITSILRNE